MNRYEVSKRANAAEMLSEEKVRLANQAGTQKEYDRLMGASDAHERTALKFAQDHGLRLEFHFGPMGTRSTQRPMKRWY